jgi:ectoine utilization protein EutD
MTTFTKADFDARVRATKTRMAERGMDVLICTDPSNMHYLTGYDGWSFYVPQAVAVSQHHDDPVWLGRGIDLAGARMTTALPEANLVAYSDRYVQAADCHPMDAMAAELVRRGWAKGTVGLEMDGYYFSPRAFAALQQGMPDARFADATALVNWVRAVKSDKEIALMREAARILERVMQTGIAMVDPANRECDAAAEIMRTQVKGLPEAGGDYTAIVPLIPSGAGTSAPHLTWRDAPFAHGQVTIMELAAARKRYHTPMSRTVFLGKPPQKMVDTAEIVVEGIHAALEVARPGNTCADVARAWTDTIERHGLSKASRCGYPIGLSYPPDWGERTMSFRDTDTTELRANMTFHFMPGIWLDDWGVAISEPIRITPAGGEPFADVPRKLIVKD